MLLNLIIMIKLLNRQNQFKNMTKNKETFEPYLNNRKSSEVFWEYAEPYLKILFKEKQNLPNSKELEKMLRLPWFIWNKVVSEEKDPGAELTRLLLYGDSIYKYNMPPGAAELIEDLEQRKKTKFNNYKYFLGEIGRAHV